ncbi:TonB-dependent receptor [uncultured Alistipes sp.]|uniref:TonB-dependent receptor n=1 Tax=uncultured Alistipes sp. TaxID=538949 RepID=UPI00265DD735|nr:TonB-dependent receptor [uncultured Alistipes sp.]
MKLYILGAVIALLMPVVAWGDSVVPAPKKNSSDANIYGHIINASNNEHLPFASIAVKGTTIGCSSDATGHYYLKNLPVGRHTIVVTLLGFETIEQPIEAVAGKNIEMNFTLEEQAMSLDEVVVSATRNETNRRRTATVVNVASQKLFESTASSNLSESMNFQSGLRVENNCGNCGTMQLRINGLEGHYSQILLDSRPIFSSLAAVYGLDQLPVAMIERVEVVRGGGSALFGSNAIGGVVNIITRDPLRNSLTLANTTHILSGGTTDINTALNGSFVSDDNKVGVYLFAQVKGRDAYDRNGDGFSDIPSLNSETAGFRAYYKTSAYTRITAEYHHTHEFRRGGDNLSEAPHMAMICEQLDHKIDGGGLRFDYFSPDSRHRMSVYTSAQGIDRSSYFGTDMNPEAYGATKDLTVVAGAQYTYGFDRLWFMPADLTIGAEYNYNTLDDSYHATQRRLEQKTSTAGFFFQNEWHSEKVNILIGGRLDKHNMVRKPIFSPRVNLRYSPIEDIGLRISYASGYRAPQAYNEDLHIDALNHSVSIIRLADDLRPEYSHSVSASADIYHSFGRLQTNLLVEGFYTMLDDVFTLEKVGTDADGNTIKERRNADGATVAGITAEVKLGIKGIFEIQAGYTFQRSRYTSPERWSDDVEPQRRMFRSPDHYGYLTSSFELARRLSASLFCTYTGPMLVQHNAGILDVDTQTTTPSFWDCGIKAAYVVPLSHVIDLEINAGVKNIFDSYQKDLDFGASKDSAYIYGPSMPRTFFVGLKLTL